MLPVPPAYTTPLGACYQGNALELLRELPDDSVSLVLTSPPYALRRKKAYGNVGPAEYTDWFLPFADEIYRVLRPAGSFVFEMARLAARHRRHPIAVPLRDDPAAVSAVPSVPGVLLVQPEPPAFAS
ncbi:MAG: DNA methyltransferase [Gemmataceae bacterium]